jgi:S-adenosylmethionine:tRNA ribosyltransferase-isomerase
MIEKYKFTLADFDFELPKDLIAQFPLEKRDISKLLVIQNNDFKSMIFSDVVDFLHPGDVLVLNNTKVIKARLFASKNDHTIELFLHKQLENNLWQAFAKPAKKIIVGDVFTFEDSKLIVREKLESGEVIVYLDLSEETNIFEFLEKYGKLPLPPYIRRQSNEYDDARYQTVFAKPLGSVAAPTAGLHFTDELLSRIKNKGINICYITLHVGAGTFLPVKSEDIELHDMHYENYSISKDTADTINYAKKNNKKIISVGTTVLRALESSVAAGEILPMTSSTNIFIKPGFEFKVADMLITNFHLPKSTLLMLVSAFAGYDTIKKAYQFAIDNKFRFFSYGDANLMYLAKST